MAATDLRRAQRRARLLSMGGAVGGLLALLGAWLSLKGPHSSVQSGSGAGESLMFAGLSLALGCGLVSVARFGLGLIRKLDGDRRRS